MNFFLTTQLKESYQGQQNVGVRIKKISLTIHENHNVKGLTSLILMSHFLCLGNCVTNSDCTGKNQFCNDAICVGKVDVSLISTVKLIY